MCDTCILEAGSVVGRPVANSFSNWIKGRNMFKQLLGFVIFFHSGFAMAQSGAFGQGLLDGILATVIYSLIGIVMATLGFKVVDWLTPGDLAEDVSRNGNRALAILAGSRSRRPCPQTA